MTPLELLLDETGQWLRRADADLRAAELCAGELPGEALYHCQQAAEKLLKAFLTWNQTPSGKHTNCESWQRCAAPSTVHCPRQSNQRASYPSMLGCSGTRVLRMSQISRKREAGNNWRRWRGPKSSNGCPKLPW
jgi:hypothetical protein